MAEVPLDGGKARVLQRDAAALGIDLGTDQAERLATFADMLLRWNRTFNIISRQDEARLVPRHLLDSLSIAPWLRGPLVLDLGTGGGLPGVPLAILRPDLSFTLVDRSQRKIRFVSQVCRALELGNVKPLCADVDRLGPEMRFDCIVSRAVTGLRALWELARPLLRSGSAPGVLLAMVSARAEQDPESGLASLELPGGRIIDSPVLRIPGLADGHRLVVVEAEEAPSAKEGGPRQ